jgi:hypothetical protein
VRVIWDGEHTLSYRSVDAVGNVEAVRTTTVQLDSWAPDLSVSGVDDLWHSTPVPAHFSATDETSGVAVVRYQLNDADWAAGDDVLVIGDGDHVLQYMAMDNAGNETALRTAHVKIDTVGPVTFGETARARAGNAARFNVVVADPLCTGERTLARIVIKSRAGRTLRTLPAAPVTIGARASVTWAKCTLKPGAYRYVVFARDAAGNPQRKAGGNKLVVK